VLVICDQKWFITLAIAHSFFVAFNVKFLKSCRQIEFGRTYHKEKIFLPMKNKMILGWKFQWGGFSKVSFNWKQNSQCFEDKGLFFVNK
jgi:hypothetical protein